MTKELHQILKYEGHDVASRAKKAMMSRTAGAVSDNKLPGATLVGQGSSLQTNGGVLQAGVSANLQKSFTSKVNT